MGIKLFHIKVIYYVIITSKLLVASHFYFPFHSVWLVIKALEHEFCYFHATASFPSAISFSNGSFLSTAIILDDGLAPSNANRLNSE
jgi:hypothetical protein